jgi:hypothetical protein
MEEKEKEDVLQSVKAVGATVESDAAVDTAEGVGGEGDSGGDDMMK